jgi:hypothetical protein
MAKSHGARRPVPRETRAPDIPAMNPDMPYCFLVTSFEEDERLLEARRAGIDPATRTFGFPTYRIDEIPKSGLVVTATREHIANAYFVIADLTGQRPNCYYEVGYAHALDRPVVHIIHQKQKPQFNVAGLHFVRYTDGADLRKKLEQYILTHVLTTHGPADDEDKNKGAFGRRAFVDPYIVTARVDLATLVPNKSLKFTIDAMVRSVDPKRPLKGNVRFHLDETFTPRTLTVTAKNGVARLSDAGPVWSIGTFTLGVTIPRTKTQLEVDLSHVPGAGPDFRRF